MARASHLRAAAGVFVTAALMLGAVAAAQQTQPPNPATVAREETSSPPVHTLGAQPGREQTVTQYTGGTGLLLRNPVTNLFPGGISTRPDLKNPVGNDPAAAQRGMAYFKAFNCIGCHADNGGGGMGRALSNSFFQYGGSVADIYLSIVQGRPNGMPAWGGMLPDAIVWDLVAYVQQLSQEPKTQWGTTISSQSPQIEQVPAEFQTGPKPWGYTEPFSHGQKPPGAK